MTRKVNNIGKSQHTFKCKCYFFLFLLKTTTFNNKEFFRFGILEVDKVSERINTFYKQQLEIDTHLSKDRVRIDRIITFSEKTLSLEI